MQLNVFLMSERTRLFRILSSNSHTCRFSFFWTRRISIHNLMFSPVVKSFLFVTNGLSLVFRVMHSESLVKNIINPFLFSAHNPTIRFHSIGICRDFLPYPKDPRMTPNRHPKLPKLFNFFYVLRLFCQTFGILRCLECWKRSKQKKKTLSRRCFQKYKWCIKKPANRDRNWHNFQKFPIFMLLLPIFQ